MASTSKASRVFQYPMAQGFSRVLSKIEGLIPCGGIGILFTIFIMLYEPIYQVCGGIVKKRTSILFHH